MKSLTRKNILRLSTVFLLSVVLTVINAFSQQIYKPSPTPASKPLLQDIPKPILQDIPVVSPTPLITKTGSTSTTTTLPVARKTSIPTLMDVDIPGMSGILVESQEGNIVLESNSDSAFNPASNVKIATVYAVLKTFGPDYRFPTSVWTDGQIDQTTGTLYGNLYISGRDPIFNLEHGINIAAELNRIGIYTVEGDLVVTDNFVMNYKSWSIAAGNTLAKVMDAGRRDIAAAKAWQNYLINSAILAEIKRNVEPTEDGRIYRARFNEYKKSAFLPSVSLVGGVYVQSIPTNARLLFTHESAQIREIIKATMCYSNNYMAERLGDMLGGPYAVARFAQINAGVPPDEFYLASSSGLGVNRVTPRAMMKVLRALQKDLAKYKMTFTDIMPVAGVDKGTLQKRFDDIFERGSVVGKTGALVRTDGGVSALAGEAYTRQGKILFVIFNQKGSIPKFLAFQNDCIALIQSQLGGAVPFAYNVIPLSVRLSNTRITYPDIRQRLSD